MNRHVDRSFSFKRTCIILYKDLSLLASLYLAHFIVWRAVRRRHKEDATRRRHFKLLNGGSMRSEKNKHESVCVNSCDFVDRISVADKQTIHEITRIHTKSLEMIATDARNALAGRKGG